MGPKKGGAPKVVMERQINIPVKYKVALHTNLLQDAKKRWLNMLEEADTLVDEDNDLQLKVAKGLRLKERFLAPEVLGRLYARYCDLINNMYDAYLSDLQLQRLDYMQEIISIIVKRMFELRNEMVHLIVNDYIYVDSSLLQLLKTPFDIQILVPYHFARGSRPDSIEEMIRTMYQESEKRLKKQAKMALKSKNAKPKEVAEEEEEERATGDESEQVEGEQGAKREEKVEEEIEEEEEEVESVHTVLSEEYIQILIIQKHERYRQYSHKAFLEAAATYRTYYAKKVQPPPVELRDRALSFIQKFYRRYMILKREQLRDQERDVLLGIIPEVDRTPKRFIDERDLLYERRYKKREKLREVYQKQIEKTKTKILLMKTGEIIEDITSEVIQWLTEWYWGYGFFPPYPYDQEGGTILVLTGEYETIEERQEMDEKIMKQTKGKDKETLKKEREQAKLDAQLKKQMLLERLKKEKIALFKARCNPQADPGYEVLQSEVSKDIVQVLRKYRQAWSIFDMYTEGDDPTTVYGFMEPLMVENIMQDLNVECRRFVDELMRLEVKTLIKAQQAMFKLVGWKWPKMRPRKKPKPVTIPKPFNVGEKMIKGVEKVIDFGLMSRPTTKLDDVKGDLKFAAYEANITDPLATFPPPGYGDVKRRIILSCIFGSGAEPGAPRNKAVMLLGIPRNGKSFIVDAVAGEMNAVKFNISPEIISTKVKKPGKLLAQVFQAARIFQPSVIFVKNIEKVFYKKVPPEEKKENAKALKAPLTKLLKTMPTTEKVIFIATCSDPMVAKQKPMMKMFSEVILVPWPDYGSIQRFFYDSLQKIKSIPRDYCVQSIAKILQGFGFGVLLELFNDVMTPERIVKLNVNPLQGSEFLENLIQREYEPMDMKQYEKYTEVFIKYSSLKTERAEYQIINMSRHNAYKKFEEVARKKAEEKARKKGGAT